VYRAEGEAWLASAAAETLLLPLLCVCLCHLQVLQQCSPVTHGLLNVLKRVFIIVGCAMLLGSPLTALQLPGVVVANAAGAVYALQQSGAATVIMGSSSSSSSSRSSAAGNFECLDGKTGDRDKPRRSWFGSGGPSHTPAGHSLSRLVHTVAGTLLVSALFLAYVVAALQSSSNSSSSVHTHVQQQQHVVQPEAVERFLVRDIQRIQCLTALHEASKVGHGGMCRRLAAANSSSNSSLHCEVLRSVQVASQLRWYPDSQQHSQARASRLQL
jgi:hypothetical protein